MNYDEFIKLIQKSKEKDWIRSNDLKHWVFRPNLAISITEDQEFLGETRFEWMTKLTQNDGRLKKYRLQYNGVLVEEVVLIEVNGVLMPIPLTFESNTGEISYVATLKHYRLATLIDVGGAYLLDEYLEKAGITIDEYQSI